jgi:hypothetical protein
MKPLATIEIAFVQSDNGMNGTEYFYLDIMPHVIDNGSAELVPGVVARNDACIDTGKSVMLENTVAYLINDGRMTEDTIDGSFYWEVRADDANDERDNSAQILRKYGIID